MDDFLYDLRHAARRLLRSPGFTAIAVLTLALGIGSTSAIFSVVHGVLLRSLPFPDPDRLVRVVTVSASRPSGTDLSPPNFMSLRERSRSFATVAAHLSGTGTLTGQGEPRQVDVGTVSDGFFEVLGVAPLLGRTIRREDGLPGAAPVAILGHSLWQQSFGGREDVLGRMATLDGESYVVIGVMPAGFDDPERREVWVPLVLDGSFSATAESGRKSNSWVPVVARLRAGSDIEAARADLRALAGVLEREYPSSNSGVRFDARTLRHEIVGSVRTPLLLLLGAVALVLLVACANIAGLMLARASGRHAELAVRAALGASQRRLVRQLLAESLLLGAAGAVMGLVLAAWATEGLLALRPSDLPRLEEIRMDGTVVGFALAVTLLTVLLVGLAPALRAARGATAAALRDSGRGGITTREGARFRAGLVVAEVAVAVVLLAGAGLLMRSFARLSSVDPGFRTEKVLTFEVDLPEGTYGENERIGIFYDALLDRIRAVPGVRSTGATNRLPLAGSSLSSRFRVEGRSPPPPGEMEPSIGVRSVTPGYFDAMGIPLRRGRALAGEDREESVPVAVINEAAARRFFRGEDPVGRRIEWFSWNPIEGRRWTIVGVVGDVRHRGLDHEPEPEIYFPFRQLPLRSMSLVVAAGMPPAELSGTLAGALRSIEADLPDPAFRTMDRVLADATSQSRFLATLLALFAIVALALAALGLFGLLSQTVVQRTREIGLRIALGARPAEVLAMVVRRALVLAAAGLVLGIVAAFALARMLRSVLFEISPSDPVALAAAVAALGLTAFAASLIPARRAAAVDPMEALRGD